MDLTYHVMEERDTFGSCPVAGQLSHVSWR
jgi:hypothetical protein